MKKFLAFDCAGDELIVGAYNGKKYNELRVIASGTENLLPMIDKLFKKSKITFNDIEVICVGIGPGSWTGARVAVVTAYGFSEGRKNLKFCTFNSFDLISYNGNDKEKILKVVKAYANFVYIENLKGEISVITKEDLFKDYKDYTCVGVTKVIDDNIVIRANLENIATTKVCNEEFVSIDTIEPMYLRLSQAEYQRAKKLEAEKICK